VVSSDTFGAFHISTFDGSRPAQIKCGAVPAPVTLIGEFSVFALHKKKKGKKGEKEKRKEKREAKPPGPDSEYRWPLAHRLPYEGRNCTGMAEQRHTTHG